MTKLAKTLLGLGIVCTVIGGIINLDVVHLGDITGFYAVLPLGAVFLGMWLIVYVVDRDGMEIPEDENLSELSDAGSAKSTSPKRELAVAGKH